MGTIRADSSGEFGHIGWQYQNYDEFLCRAAEYIAIGLNLDQRVVYVGADEPATLRAALAAAGLGAGSDEVDVETVPEHFRFRAGGEIVDAKSMAERYAAAAIASVADGYSGLRIVIDVTPVVRTPAQREAQAALEFLGDRRNRHLAANPAAAAGAAPPMAEPRCCAAIYRPCASCSS